MEIYLMLRQMVRRLTPTYYHLLLTYYYVIESSNNGFLHKSNEDEGFRFRVSS